MISFLHCYFIPLCTKSVGVISLLQTVIIHARLSPPLLISILQCFTVVSPYSQGCQAGSILHRLSWLLAAATRVLTRLSAPSKVARSEILQSEVKINNLEFPKAKNCRFFSFLDLSYEFFLTYCLLEVKISCLKKTSVQLKEYNRGTFAKVA